MRYKYIFWDFNGTVIDDVQNALACVNDMLERKGKSPITLEEYYTYVETPIIRFYYHILPPEEIDFDEISRDYHRDYARHLDDTRTAKGIPELLKELKEFGVHQYIVTANHIDEVTQLTDKFGITEYFEKIIGADDHLAASKTERAKALFDSLKIEPNDAIFIGDTLHDLETANALGIDCVLVAYGHQGRRLLESHNTYTVENADEIRNIIFDTRTVDLHTHSTCSDGTLSPEELVVHAKNEGLCTFALTDHDSVDGLKRASEKSKQLGIEFINGIEFSTVDAADIHIIGLFIDTENETLLKTIETLRKSRKERMKKICENLRKLGFDISFEDALEISGTEFVGRPHIAKAMVEKGYCKTNSECFEKYIGNGKPAYVKKTELNAVDAVKTIKSAGGLAFLAHLNQTEYTQEQLEKLLIKLKSAGLDGIEGYYTEYTHENVTEYRALAEKLSLAISGGSDYHADMKPNISIGTGYGNLSIPYYIVDNMKGILKRNRLK